MRDSLCSISICILSQDIRGDKALKLWTPGESDQKELEKMAQDIQENMK